MRKNFKKALLNIVKHGDTDIFPFPFERYLFEDKLEECLDILEDYHKNFEQSLSLSPPINLETLSQVGYYGFRQATLIEPFWNAYYLGIVISLAEKIENKRIKEAEKNVFSYRYEWNAKKNSLFKDANWIDYKKQCVEYSKKFDYVLQTDISNFYPRINHHKLENALKKIDTTDIPKRILRLLSIFSGTISYGLPVGGPASRILAELALNNTDLNLKSKGIVFCRYVDDYTIFCNSESEAYKSLILLSEKLSNAQLSLQKDKTKIMSSEEFREIHYFLDPISDEIDNPEEEQKLLNISIRFDPYSATADEDYETIKQSIRQIDIIGILSREVNKTRIDQTVTKQAINSIKALTEENQVNAVKILLDSNNLLNLSPVFTTIIRAVRSVYDDLVDAGKDFVDSALLELFAEENYLTKIEINLNYIVQILSLRHSPAKETIFINLFETETNHLLKRQIIVAMTNWDCDFWLGDVKSQFTTLTMWERRSIIYSSYYLGDEGKHWRDHNKNLFSKEEVLMRDWFADRKQLTKPVLV